MGYQDTYHSILLLFTYVITIFRTSYSGRIPTDKEAIANQYGARGGAVRGGAGTGRSGYGAVSAGLGCGS